MISPMSMDIKMNINMYALIPGTQMVLEDMKKFRSRKGDIMIDYTNLSVCSMKKDRGNKKNKEKRVTQR